MSAQAARGVGREAGAFAVIAGLPAFFQASKIEARLAKASPAGTINGAANIAYVLAR